MAEGDAHHSYRVFKSCNTLWVSFSHFATMTTGGSTMLFLGPFYNWINTTSLSRVNHFPLVRLIVFSLDKTILYLLIFAALRCLWLLVTKRRTTFGRELKLGIFVGYLMLLFALTVFRDVYYPWQLHFHWNRPLSVINIRPLTTCCQSLRSLVSITREYCLVYAAWLWYSLGEQTSTASRGHGYVWLADVVKY